MKNRKKKKVEILSFSKAISNAGAATLSTTAFSIMALGLTMKM
jgi:hypothetical protein